MCDFPHRQLALIGLLGGQGRLGLRDFRARSGVEFGSSLLPAAGCRLPAGASAWPPLNVAKAGPGPAHPMEREPARYAWKHARLAHVVAFLGVLALLPVTWLGLDLPRLIIDNVLLGKAFDGRTTAFFPRLVVDLPYPLLDAPIVLVQGVQLGREAYLAGALALFVAVGLVRAAILGGLGVLRGALSRQLAGRLRRALFGRVIAARASARDEASAAADLVGRGVGGVWLFLGDVLIVPTLAIGQIGVSIVFAAALDAWLGLTLAAIALAHGLAIPRAAVARERRDAARAAREAEVTRAARDVARRVRAIRVHGTAATEEGVFGRALDEADRVWRGFGLRLATTNMARGMARDMAPIGVLAVGGLLVLRGSIGLGDLVAALIAALLLARPVAALADWAHARRRALSVFNDIARVTGALQARERRAAATPLATTRGRLVARDLAALDPISGVRIAGVSLAIDLPARVALVGDTESGATVFARLLGGGIESSSGSLAIGETELSRMDKGGATGQISYAGGEPVLLPGSLRDNLLYGAPDATLGQEGLVRALSVAGLDDEVYALGLAGSPDGAGEAAAADALIEARRAVRAAVSAEGLADLVDPFDAGAYTRHASLAENLMFGVPVGDTFREANLARHPFVRAVIEAESLTAPLADMGLAIAHAMVEIFEGVPDGHPLFERFSFFQARDRGAYEDLVARQSERRRGASAARDRDLLIALALRYVETRHRLGLLDPALERRIVEARASFRSLLPASLGPAIEFYDPERLCAAASLADNLLFGRVAHDVAGAEGRVRALVRRILTERGLDPIVFRIGLAARVGEREPAALAGQAVALDLARCLLRRPGILVVGALPDNLGTEATRHLLERLKEEMRGRAIFVVLDDASLATGFDTRLDFARGGLIAG